MWLNLDNPMPVAKDQVLYDSAYMRCLQLANPEIEQIMDCLGFLGLGMEWVGGTVWGQGAMPAKEYMISF